MNTQELEQSVNLAEYYYILAKHKWLIIISFVIVTSLTAFFSFRMAPVYRATATMVIENQQTRSPLTGESLEYSGYVTQTLAFNTHLKLITSRPVLEKIIRIHKLDRAEKEVKTGKEGISQLTSLKDILSLFRKNLRVLLGGEEKILSSQDKKAALIAGLRRKIEVSEVRDTLLMKVDVEDHEPVMAKNIANDLARAYIEFNTASRLKSSQNTLNWMKNQLYETQKKLEDAEANFLAYKQNQKLFSIQGKQNIITQKIEDFNNAYIGARNKRLELDAKLGKLRRTLKSKGEILHVRSLIDNPLIDTLYARLHETEVELNRLRSIFKPKHPKIIQIMGKIDETRRRLGEELKKEVENLKSERSVLYTKERILQETIGDFENDALETGKKELQYTILQRNVNTHQKLYDILLSKVKESKIEENLDVSNIRIAEDAVTPLAPVKPNKTRNIMMGVLIGLMIGIGFSFLLEYMDRSVRTEEDIQKYIGIQVLSVIPEAELP